MEEVRVTLRMLELTPLGVADAVIRYRVGKMDNDPTPNELEDIRMIGEALLSYYRKYEQLETKEG